MEEKKLWKLGTGENAVSDIWACSRSGCHQRCTCQYSCGRSAGKSDKRCKKIDQNTEKGTKGLWPME